MKTKDLYSFYTAINNAQAIVLQNDQQFTVVSVNEYRSAAQFNFILSEGANKAIFNYIALFGQNNAINAYNHLIVKLFTDLLPSFETHGGNLLHSNLTLTTTLGKNIDYEELTPLAKLNLSTFFFVQQKALQQFIDQIQLPLISPFIAHPGHPHTSPAWGQDPSYTSVADTLSRQTPISQAPYEQWLDNSEVCLMLRISKRTLQSYRDKKIIPFTKFGGKIYYKASDIYKFLSDNYNLPNS